MRLIGGICCISMSALAGNDIDSSSSNWRCPANGGINILYCYLRINGITCNYSNLLHRQEDILGHREFTALTMEQLAAKNGLQLKVVSLKMEDLKACSLPVIVHIDGDSPQIGAFLLLFGISDREVNFMYGPSASISNMDLESFMRIWSGTALLPAKEPHKEIILFLLGSGIGLVLTGCRQTLLSRGMKAKSL